MQKPTMVESVIVGKCHLRTYFGTYKQFISGLWNDFKDCKSLWNGTLKQYFHGRHSILHHLEWHNPLVVVNRVAFYIFSINTKMSYDLNSGNVSLRECTNNCLPIEVQMNPLAAVLGCLTWNVLVFITDGKGSVCVCVCVNVCTLK